MSGGNTISSVVKRFIKISRVQRVGFNNQATQLWQEFQDSVSRSSEQ
jgi:hypothetical protein